MRLDKIKKQNLLQIFNLITTEGTKEEGVYLFSGITAWHDFDGYTCWLAYEDLTITLMFHGCYDFDYLEDDTLDIFSKKIDKLLSNQNLNNA